METSIVNINKVERPQFDMKYREVSSDLIKYVETLIRKSLEYNKLIDLYKKTFKIDECAFYDGFSIKNGLKIQFHHHPFTLYDYTESVMTKHLRENKFWDEDEVAEEVMKLHFELKVGLIPLSPTCHELYHSGVLKLSPKLIVSDGYKDFYNEYKEFHSDTVINKWEKIIDEMNNYKEDEYPVIITRKKIFYNIDKFAKLDNDILDKMMIEDRLKEIDDLPTKGDK